MTTPSLNLEMKRIHLKAQVAAAKQHPNSEKHAAFRSHALLETTTGSNRIPWITYLP